jgi:riboflavin biosynthesis pyrimidine reductase
LALPIPLEGEAKMTQASEISEIHSAADVDAMAKRLYGDGFDPRRPGVLHVTAVWRCGTGEWVTIRIEERTPKSEHDFFVLNLCRARADAIVTSGKNLREERDLRHDLAGPGRVVEALASWRRRLGKSEPPISLVLTSGRGLDPGHPLFRSSTRPLVYTSPEGREQLADVREQRIEVVADPGASLRSAIAFLRRERDARTIVVETGPSTSMGLYDPPLSVDELFVSIYEEDLDEVLRGGAFLSQEDVEVRFTQPEPSFRARSDSGHWSFRRYLAT